MEIYQDPVILKALLCIFIAHYGDHLSNFECAIKLHDKAFKMTKTS